MSSGVTSWSTTANSNATADSTINWAEGMAPSAVNDSARAMMARIADWRDSLNGSNATTGGTTAYVLTSDQSFAALSAGLEVAFQINATNTGTSTLNVDSLGAKPLRSAAGVEVVAGALKIGAVYRATYFTSNSGEWLLHDYTPTIIAADQVVTASIINDAVTYTKIQNVSATKRALGRNTSGAGDVEEVTFAQMQNWLGTPARGDIIRQGATDPERLALGTSGKVLASDGTDVVWANPSRILLATLTANNSAEVGDDDIFTSDYAFYEIEFSNVINATDAQELRFQIYSGSYRTSGYVAHAHGVYSTGAGISYAPTTHIPLSGTTDADNLAPGACGKLRLYNPSANAKCIVLGEFTYRYNSASLVFGSAQVTGCWDTAGVVTGFRFFSSSGDLASGTFKVYAYN